MTYGTQRAVDDISFEVKTGQVVGFLGPNGAGKTTTMKIITGFMAPTSGEVSLDNFSIQDHPEEVKRRIGYLPEHNPLYHDMPVIDYLSFVAALQGVEKSKIPGRVREMIQYVGLNVEKHKKIGELSKGYRQRVGLAQAIIHDPEVLILDEPTTGLDPNQIVEIRKLIKDLAASKTIILSTHILPEVEQTCDRVLIINQGRIVADGTPATLRHQLRGTELLHVRIECPEGVSALEAIKALPSVASASQDQKEPDKYTINTKADESSRRPVFTMCCKNGWFLTEMTGVETRLEDVFRELTGDSNN
jgi:ABC-2 type transport system ATP-binding protein